MPTRFRIAVWAAGWAGAAVSALAALRVSMPDSSRSMAAAVQLLGGGLALWAGTFFAFRGKDGDADGRARAEALVWAIAYVAGSTVFWWLTTSHLWSGIGPIGPYRLLAAEAVTGVIGGSLSGRLAMSAEPLAGMKRVGRIVLVVGVVWFAAQVAMWGIYPLGAISAGIVRMLIPPLATAAGTACVVACAWCGGWVLGIAVYGFRDR